MPVQINPTNHGYGDGHGYREANGGAKMMSLVVAGKNMAEKPWG